jgi:uncharacterized protein
MKMFVIGAIMACVFVASPVAADEQRERTLAAQVVRDAGIREQVLQGIELGLPSARQQIRTMAPTMDAERFIVLFREEIDKVMPTILEEIARSYMEHFSEEELAQIAAFYQSPTGRSMVAKMPALTNRGAQIGQTYGAQAGVAAAARLLAEGARPSSNP